MALSSLRTGGGGTAFLLRRVLSPRSVSEQNLSSSSSSENKPEIKNSLQLYKHLVRQTQKLPPDAANFYKDSIRRGYSQHTEETDPERLKQIYSRAVEDADWVVKKYTKK